MIYQDLVFSIRNNTMSMIYTNLNIQRCDATLQDVYVVNSLFSLIKNN